MDELAVIDWILPESRPGYRAYRTLLSKMIILGEGRWGAGDYIAGNAGDTIDIDESMKPVFAHGMIEGGRMSGHVTIHEESDGRIEIHMGELTGSPSTERPEMRRWCYSYWAPGDGSPRLERPVREIRIEGEEFSVSYLLCVAPEEEMLWVHDTSTGINHLMPHTSFYTELMESLGIRDPKRVTAPRSLFRHHAEFTDVQLIQAIRSYNNKWKRFEWGAIVPITKHSGARTGTDTTFDGSST